MVVEEDGAPALAGVPLLVEAAGDGKGTGASLRRCGLRASAGFEIRGLWLEREWSPRLLGSLVRRSGRLPLRRRLLLLVRIGIGRLTGQSLGLKLDVH